MSITATVRDIGIRPMHTTQGYHARLRLSFLGRVALTSGSRGEATPRKAGPRIFKAGTSLLDRTSTCRALCFARNSPHVPQYSAMDSSGRSDAKDAYKRSYVACHGCRSRKVRCLIETEPPCARCKREHRDCTFNDRAKSYKGRHPPKWAHTGKSRDLASVHSQTSPRGHGVEQSASGMNPTANLQTSPSAVSDRMISTVTSGSADALNLLFDSARPDVSDAPRGDGNISPIVSRSTEGIGFTITTLSDPEDEVLDMWDRCRFVRQGWFTAQEAVTYVDLYAARLW